MPHGNVLDLSVFPAMSRIYCNLIREKEGLRAASNNDMCNCAKEVWDAIPNEKRGHAFVQYWSTLSTVIKGKGGNVFVVTVRTMHCGVSKYFNPAKNGISPINK